MTQANSEAFYWLIQDKFCTFDEKVRVELGPQIIELDCTDENLRDEITAPHYRIGARDAYGKVIRPNEAEHPADAANFGIVEKGEKMHCVDWRAKHVPHVWKIYENEEPDKMDDDGKKIGRFIKVAEYEDKDEALKHAGQLAKEMN